MDNRNKIPHLSMTIYENDIFNGADKVLEIIRPTWSKENIEHKVRI